MPHLYPDAWLQEQVDDYRSIFFAKAARGQAVIAVAIYLVAFITTRLYQGAPVANILLTVTIVGGLTYLVSRGKTWAIVALLVILPLQLLLVFPIYEVVIYAVLLLSVLFRALKVEISRQNRFASPTPPA